MPDPDFTPAPPTPAGRISRLADWLGLNRASLAVLAVIGCLGLSEELWANFLSLHLRDQAAAAGSGQAVLEAALYMGVFACLKNLLEGCCYILGGTFSHHLGPRVALALCGAPMVLGFTLLLLTHQPWAIVLAALLTTNWEPLSVPATFEVVGSEVPRDRRTIAFAVQSIQKRLPKVVGPLAGGLALGAVGYWLNLSLAFGLVGLAILLQFLLTARMRPKKPSVAVPLRKVLREMPSELKALLSAEIFIRWGDWFARDFAVLYVVSLLTAAQWGEAPARECAGALLALQSFTALVTYIPLGKLIDRLGRPRPFIGLTFFLFAIFPLCLVGLPRLASWSGWSPVLGLVLAFLLNGLRELGEPARKALITTGFPEAIRARAVGLYWGLRSFAFCPAPLLAAWLWSRIGPEYTFLLGSGIGLLGVVRFCWRGPGESGQPRQGPAPVAG